MLLDDIIENRVKRRADIPKWQAAAEADDVAAQVSLAWEYVRGELLDQNIATAWRWFERAAASGQEEALVNRARFLQLRGVPGGVRELRQLAVKGNWKAQFWLAQHYQSKAGRVSQLRAVVWFDRSLKSGNGSAKIAKLAVLARIAPLWSKPVFVAKELVEMAAAIWRLTWDGHPPEIYQPLLYQLKKPGG